MKFKAIWVWVAVFAMMLSFAGMTYAESEILEFQIELQEVDGVSYVDMNSVLSHMGYSLNYDSQNRIYEWKQDINTVRVDMSHNVVETRMLHRGCNSNGYKLRLGSDRNIMVDVTYFTDSHYAEVAYFNENTFMKVEADKGLKLDFVILDSYYGGLAENSLVYNWTGELKEKITPEYIDMVKRNMVSYVNDGIIYNELQEDGSFKLAKLDVTGLKCYGKSWDQACTLTNYVGLNEIKFAHQFKGIMVRDLDSGKIKLIDKDIVTVIREFDFEEYINVNGNYFFVEEGSGQTMVFRSNGDEFEWYAIDGELKGEVCNSAVYEVIQNSDGTYNIISNKLENDHVKFLGVSSHEVLVGVEKPFFVKSGFLMTDHSGDLVSGNNITKPVIEEERLKPLSGSGEDLLFRPFADEFLIIEGKETYLYDTMTDRIYALSADDQDIEVVEINDHTEYAKVNNDGVIDLRTPLELIESSRGLVADRVEIEVDPVIMDLINDYELSEIHGSLQCWDWAQEDRLYLTDEVSKAVLKEEIELLSDAFSDLESQRLEINNQFFFPTSLTYRLDILERAIHTRQGMLDGSVTEYPYPDEHSRLMEIQEFFRDFVPDKDILERFKENDLEVIRVLETDKINLIENIDILNVPFLHLGGTAMPGRITLNARNIDIVSTYYHELGHVWDFCFIDRDDEILQSYLDIRDYDLDYLKKRAEDALKDPKDDFFLNRWVHSTAEMFAEDYKSALGENGRLYNKTIIGDMTYEQALEMREWVANIEENNETHVYQVTTLYDMYELGLQ